MPGKGDEMSGPKAIYETVIQIHSSEKQDELDRTVLRILQRHVGKSARIEREFLVAMVYGDASPYMNSVHDRRVREAIERLRERHVILSSSGCGGYWLPESQEEAQEFIREMETRARKELHTVSQMRKLLWKQFSGQGELVE
jgi:hypothetical protein